MSGGIQITDTSFAIAELTDTAKLVPEGGGLAAIRAAKQAEWGLAALEGRPVRGILWRFDGRTLTERESVVRRAADCPAEAAA